MTTRRTSWLLLALTLPALIVGCAGQKEVATEAQEENWITLFEGESLDGWTHVGPGGFALQADGSMKSEGGMGLLYYDQRSFRDYVLELDYKTSSDTANSGIFLRFPERPTDPGDAVEGGYEVQIDDASGPIHQTGAIYDQSAAFRNAAKPAGEWNTYRIKVTGQRYEVFLNGEKVNDFFGDRGREGFLGVQNHDPGSTVWFRDIRVKPLSGRPYPESLAEWAAVEEERDPIRVLMVTTTHGYRHGPAIERSKPLMEALENTTEFTFDATEDLTALNKENLAQYDLLFLNNSTLRSHAGVEEETSASDDEVWRGYDLRLDVPDQPDSLQGTLTLYGEPGDLSGTIQFENQPSPGSLEEVSLTGSELTFHFTVDQYGRIDGAVTTGTDRLEGTLTLTDQRGQVLALRGTALNEDSVRTASSPDVVTTEQQQAILDFIRDGNGVVGAHAALDAFYEWDAYREMVGGGLFKEHPWTQSVQVTAEAPNNPAMAEMGERFWIRDEIYVLDENPRWNSRVLSSSA